jgi:KDO2-lipid IV(A) lauroyltransferase
MAMSFSLCIARSVAMEESSLPMKPLWKQIRYRLEYFACKVLAALIPLLPRGVCLRLARLLGALYYRLDRKTRAVALDNLRLALGESVSPEKREWIARESFGNFARTMLDLFWARRLTPQNYARHMVMEGFEEARKLRDQHGGIIFVTQHYGGYEWLSLAVGFSGMPVWIVALDFKNPALDAVFATAREHSGHRLIGRKQSMLKLLRAVKRNGGAGMLVDLGLHMNQPGVVIEGLGMKMHVTFLHALLHQRTGIPLVPMTNVPLPDGRCRMTAHPPLSFPQDATHQDITQGCWDFFEPIIRAQPQFWLWNYRHWRYRPRGATREYPFYAHESGKFERALAGKRAVRRKDEG